MKNLLLFLIMVANSSLFASNLYWINGTGNWDDATHWSNTSGGSSCGCVPTLNDDVFFDAKSFSGFAPQVTINTTAYCNNISWTGATNTPQLTGSAELHINGSLTLISGMSISSYTGMVYFESPNEGQKVTSAGKQFQSNIYFSNGEYTLQDAFNTKSGLFLEKGQLNFNSQNVTAYYFSSNNSNFRSLILGNSAITINGYYNYYYNSYSWYCNQSNFSINTGSSTITFTYAGTVNFVGGSQPYYNLVFNNGSGNQGQVADGNNTFNNVTFKGTGNINSESSTFNKLFFTGDGVISGNNSADSVIFSAGKTYTLGSNNTLSIGSFLQANGSCSSWIDLKSSSPGTQAKLNSISGKQVTISYVRMRDINALNGNFIDNNAWDMGNNSGWTMNQIPPKNLYWIGNGGNWDNPAHWSLTSGGVSNGCIPTIYDDVFFDAKSFSGFAPQVTINTSAYCNNMSWTGATNTPNLMGSSELHINGSLTLISGMNISSYTGMVYFESPNEGQKVTSGGKQFQSNIYFSNGGYTLQDAFNTKAGLFLEKGQLNFNSQNVTAYYFSSNNSNFRSLIMGNSAISITGYYNYYYSSYSWNCNPSNLSISNGSSSITFTYPGTVNFVGGSKPYYNLVFNNGSTNQGQINDGNNTFNNVTFNGIGNISSENNTFNNLSFTDDGTISGNNTFNNISFAQGKTYNLGSNTTQSIKGDLYSSGVQGSNVTIKATSNGYRATINKTSGIVCLEYVTIKDIAVSGGARYFGSVGSVDNGNNTGWTFGPCPHNVAGMLDFITPTVGGNIGEVTINVNGIFPANSILKLTKTGESDILIADSLAVNINNTRIKATADLTGKSIGLWNIIVEVPGDTIMRLENAFSIVTGVIPIIQTEIIGGTAVRTNVWQNFSISYTNMGNINAKGVPIWLVFPNTANIEILSSQYRFPDHLGMDKLHGVLPIDSLDSKPIGNDSLMCFVIPNIPPNSNGTINFRLKSSISGNLKLYSWASSPFYPSTTNSALKSSSSITTSPFPPGLGACIDDIASAAIGFIKVPGVQCSYSILRTLIDPAIKYAYTNSTEGMLIDVVKSVLETSITCFLDLSGGDIALTAVKLFKNMSGINTLASFHQSCSPYFFPNAKNQTDLQSVTSIDPNDIVGPIGSGSQAFHAINRSIPYLIRYENADSATAPVQVLSVIDTINGSMFDLSTFEFGFITIGDTSISISPGQKSLIYDYYIQPPVNVIVRINAEFNVQTGIVSWLFTSLDPITEKPITDVLSGFLPPNINAPAGEGSVFFTIKPRATLNQNAIFNNKAYIIFDNNPAIVTNTWSNTVDKIPPVSEVFSLIPLQVDSSFSVTWSSSDVGAGERHYNIYYSENGGNYNPWLINTETTSGIFTGKRDNTYAFFSIATDKAGNIETAPSSPDATTKVLLTGIKTLDHIYDLQIYPNPNSGSFYISLESDNVDKLEISCLDTYGKTVYYKDYGKINGKFITELNLSSVAKGLYVVCIKSDGKSVYKKVIITD